MEAIDQHDVANDHLLSTVQGNILKGHGRDHTANIFIEFHSDHVAAARTWLSDFAKEKVISTKEQLAQTERFKDHGTPGGLFAGVYVSWAGYEYFQVPDSGRPDDPQGAFEGGMQNAELNDPDVALWDPTFRDLKIHLMVLLGHDDKVVLSKAVASLIGDVRKLTLPKPLKEEAIKPYISDKISIEYGNAIRNANGDGLEHFGYVDGISQPLFFKDEIEKDKERRNPKNKEEVAWDPAAETALVLVDDYENATTKGSFYVFRKLEQDVRAFKRAERDLAITLKLPKEELELAGAMLVGRFEDGTPVTLYGDDGMIGSGNANNFNYEQDMPALKCPFQGHIRKTNPRRNDGDKKHVMARRGIPYGLREVSTEFDCEPEQFPTGGGVGLLFQSFQASLTVQFEFIQKFWANNVDFPNGDPSATGVDPLIGQVDLNSPDPDAARTFIWPKRHGGPDTCPASFPEMVKMKGGEYFFAPSLPTLQNFGGGIPVDPVQEEQEEPVNA